MVNRLNRIGSPSPFALRGTERGLRLDPRLSGSQIESSDAARAGVRVFIRAHGTKDTDAADVLEDLRALEKSKRHQEGTLKGLVKELTTISGKIQSLTDEVLGSGSADGSARKEEVRALVKEFQELVGSDGFKAIREKVSALLSDVKAGKAGKISDVTASLLGSDLLGKLRSGDLKTAETVLKHLDSLSGMSFETDYPAPDLVAQMSQSLEALTGALSKGGPGEGEQSRFTEVLSAVLRVARKVKHHEYMRSEEKNPPPKEKALDEEIEGSLNELKGIANSADFKRITELVKSTYSKMLNGEGREFVNVLEKQFKRLLGKEFIDLLKTFDLNTIGSLSGTLGRIQQFGEMSLEESAPIKGGAAQGHAVAERQVADSLLAHTAEAVSEAALPPPPPKKRGPNEAAYAELIKEVKKALSILAPDERQGTQNKEIDEESAGAHGVDSLKSAKEALITALTQRLFANSDESSVPHLLSAENVRTVLINR